VVSAVFNPDDSQVLTACADGTARIWRAGDGAPIATLRHRGPVTSGSFSRDGKLVLTTSRDGTARLWRAETGAPVLVFEHGRPVLSGSLSDDGRLLDGPVGSPAVHVCRRSRDGTPTVAAKGVTTASQPGRHALGHRRRGPHRGGLAHGDGRRLPVHGSRGV
jgi:WD40 repeat protein